MVIPRKRWTRTEYQRLIEDGILQAGKVELVNGEIWEKQKQGRRHTIVITWLLRAFDPVFGIKHLQCQASLPIDDYSEPEPDMAVLAENIEHYLDIDPTPSDTLLVVEASNTSLHVDLTDKQQMYARSSIPEYWVVDIPNRLLHVFRAPTETGYAQETIFTADEEVRPLAASETAIRVQDLLPPA